MVRLNDALDAKIIYEEFSGECFNVHKELIVIVGLGDNSGIPIEHEDGEENSIRPSNIYIPKAQYDICQALRSRYS